MYSTKNIKTNEKALVAEGQTVSLSKIKFKSAASANLPPLDKGAFTEMFRKAFKEELASEGIKLAKGSKNKVQVTITRLDRGCGVCRGFFPVFGLGHSYLDAKVKFKTPAGSKIFALEKTGQTSGIGAMDDQTPDNIEYLAIKMAGEITGKQIEEENE